MKVKNFFATAALAVVVSSSLVGCGGPKTIPANVAPAVEQSKKLLQEIATSGNSPGSGAMILNEALAEIGKTDAAKAKTLEADVAAFMTATKPEDLKAKAKALLEKL
ncbi:MAG: hypothetical protein RLY14_1263 [Planctomycetota bacterium]